MSRAAEGGAVPPATFFDEFGNLRVMEKGDEADFHPDEELMELLQVELDAENSEAGGAPGSVRTAATGRPGKGKGKAEDDAGVEVVVVDSTWVNLWLAYVHTRRGVSPRPGPLQNAVLLQPRTVEREEGSPPETVFVARDNLRPERLNKRGHYRAISREAWDALASRYPGSGPLIVAGSRTYQDPLKWNVDQSYFKREDINTGVIKRLDSVGPGLEPTR